MRVLLLRHVLIIRCLSIPSETEGSFPSFPTPEGSFLLLSPERQEVLLWPHPPSQEQSSAPQLT